MPSLLDHMPIPIEGVSRAEVVHRRRRRHRRRSFTLIVLCGSALLLVAATIAWGWQSASVASNWQERSEALAADLRLANDALRSANGQVDARTADLNELRPRTVAAEAAAQALQQQLDSANDELQAVAASKAALGDRERILQATLAEGTAVTADLRRCIGALVSAGSVAAAGSDVIASCDRALARAAAFDAGAASLRP